MKWQLRPSRNTACSFVVVGIVAQTTFSGSLSLICRYKRTAVVWYTLAFTQSVLVVLLRSRAMIEKSKPFLWLVYSQIQDQQWRECNRGKKTVFLLCCLRSSERWKLSDIENYNHIKCVAKMSVTCQNYSSRTVARQLLSTKVWILQKVNLRTIQPYCITHIWQWFDKQNCVQGHLTFSTDCTVVIWTCKETIYPTNSRYLSMWQNINYLNVQSWTWRIYCVSFE